MLSRPLDCLGCPLDSNPKTQGFVLPTGPTNAPILFLGEAAGEEEARQGLPFVGAAGGMLNRLLTRNRWDRNAYRIANVISCRPPSNWFDERAPWYFGARQHCRVHRDPVLQEQHPVIVALGTTALKTLLGIDKGIRMEDFHGTVTPTPHGLVVPTFHPSFLQRGATNLFGVVSFDLQQAHKVAREGWTQDDVSIVVDPPLEWATWWVEQVEAAVLQDPASVWLAVDIETPDKSSGQDEGMLSSEDRSYTIVRVNFSVHPDEGVSFPYAGPYVALCQRLFQLACAKALWNKEYDEPRIRAAGHTLAGDWYDFMWAWHQLQSDVPRGLGFAAPFYCAWGPWKHLAGAHPGYYAAIDGFKTYRVATGIARDMVVLGLWETFARHVHALHAWALKPAQQLGVKIDRARLVVFIHDLEVKQRRILHAMQGLVPEEVRPLTPKGGYKRQPEEGKIHAKGTDLKRDGTAKKEAPDPIKQELYAQTARVVHRRVRTLAICCDTCGAVEVSKSHRCGAPGLVSREVEVDRWYWQEPFNPDSPDQILAYILYRGHKPGRAKKTGNDSTDRETLDRLTRETKDPLYAEILRSRAVGKVKGTYGVGTLKRLDPDDRVHPTPTFKPSTQRLSYVDPNITNVIADKDDAENLASGFRACVVATQEEPKWEWAGWNVGVQKRAPAVLRGCRLAEFDFAGIEAVLTGWYMQAADPHQAAEYIRLAKLGVHAGLASHVLGRPYDVAWSDAQIAAYFKEIKAGDLLLYDRCKRTVHGTNYGLTEFGMVRNFPQVFPTLQVARKFKKLYALMAPALPTWHTQVRERAYQQNYLGGPGDHPYGYKHWFWDVIGFRGIPYSVYLKRQKAREPVTIIQGKYYAITLGGDAKRVVAFYPQSTAAGVLKEVMLRLFDPENPSYIGDAYYGRTPFRAPIHDSLLLEIPNRVWDRVTEKVFLEMLRPVPELPLDWVAPADRQRLGFGSHLTIGVEGKQGLDWQTMEKIPAPTLQELGVSTDGVTFPVDEDEESAEEMASLGTVA